MGESCRCTVKWDSKEGPHHVPGEHNDLGFGRAGNRESQPRWHHGERNYNDQGEPLDATMMWDGETTMSPGLDGWGQLRHNRSPERSQRRSCRTRSRSRSRSLETSFRQAGLSDGSTGDQPCKDIVGAKSCTDDFSFHNHQNYKDAEDRRRQGRHGRIDASKYFKSDDTREQEQKLRTGRSNDFTRESSVDISRGTGSGGRNKDTSFAPCKFFASGNCRYGNFCRFSHYYGTHEPFDNGDKNEIPRVLEKRAKQASQDGCLATESRYKVHGMDGNETRKNNDRDCHMLTSYSTGSVMDVSQSRGATVEGVEEGLNHSTQPSNLLVQEEGSSQASAMATRPIFGLNAVHKAESYTSTGNPLPPQDAMSREADVMHTVKSGTAQSTQGTMSPVRFSNFTLSLSQLRELYAALNASNILGFKQSSVPSSAGPDAVHPSVSSQPESDSEYVNLYDPVKDSLELINSVISEQPDELKLDSSQNKVYINEKPDMPSKLPLAGEPSCADLHITDCNNVDININSNRLSIKDEVADCKSEENDRMKAQEKNKGQDSCDLENTEGDGKSDERKENNDGKSIRAFKFTLAEFVKELLKPTWKEGRLNKEAHKTIVKKVVDKVTYSIQGVHLPQSQVNIESYLSSAKPKISKLVQAYVDRVKKEKPIVDEAKVA